MNRIDQTFHTLKSQRRVGLVPFFTCGDPSLESAVHVMHALVAGGADLIELGVPFSDPQADGPVIQRSSERALQRKVGLRQVLQVCAEFRSENRNTPVVLMGYLNPIEIFGVERFAAAAAEAGVDGVLLVDCPPEEAGTIRSALGEQGVQMVLLASPTTSDERLGAIVEQAQGYLYYVSFAGVTGASRLAPAEVSARVAKLKALSAVPVAVGFGVRDAESAKALAAEADAVVIGSALVESLAQAETREQATRIACEFLTPIRRALDG
ncbi:tryptophan synthase subunit alpha [Pseudomarimonas arenosa]|uniref:Tryptophan synthase alpha chain n=1 Tax=Pseudomarimonas arenosa TaxID=2774145 RepID=A0AAW3ZP86_9GAMM|nr:tryptophan synthase subunit alpha [Pseudomarimonas arenosa]MBD8527988.1 tryptophan synthase subunit alpha [Pseudomarimonas arenosa]